MATTYVSERVIPARYRDPLDVVWLTTARRLGLTVRRQPEVYACTDGRGQLTLSTPDGFDPDDTVAQMVLHEVCHWVVNGVETFHQPDWGFELDWQEDWRELACQRLQAALADRAGLRAALASTGTYRPYYDRLAEDPFAPLDDSAEEARVCAEARAAYARALGEPWGAPLDAALQATARLRQAIVPFLADYAPDHPDDGLPSWWR
jgi:hypothetical protein